MVREELANYAVRLAGSSDVPLEDRVRVIRKAIAFLEESILQEPFDARHYMYRASVVNRTADLLLKADPPTAKTILEKSVTLLQTAERLSPTRPQVYLEEAQTLEMLGRKDESIAALKKAVDLNPTVKGPHVDLIAVSISAGRLNEAAAEYQKLKGLSFELTAEEYNRLIRLYSEQKQIAQIASLYREQLDRTPNDPKLLAHLATAYREMGDLDHAREAAMKAAAQSPELAASLKEFLDSLAKAGRR
jgi:tetratricopeptide (TPR) repeat protein